MSWEQQRERAQPSHQPSHQPQERPSKTEPLPWPHHDLSFWPLWLGGRHGERQTSLVFPPTLKVRPPPHHPS